MYKLLFILLFVIASCIQPLSPQDSYCVQYRIGGAHSTANVQFVDGYVICDNWRLSITSTPSNQTRLFRDTTLPEFDVYSSTEFLFANNQVSDTIRGICIRHTKGNTCNTTDTIPVTVIKIPCTKQPHFQP